MICNWCFSYDCFTSLKKKKVEILGVFFCKESAIFVNCRFFGRLTFCESKYLSLQKSPFVELDKWKKHRDKQHDISCWKEVTEYLSKKSIIIYENKCDWYMRETHFVYKIILLKYVEKLPYPR